MQYRSYKDGDSKAMFALDELCFEPPFRFTARAMLQFATAANALVVVAEAQETLAGFVIAHVQTDALERFAYIVTLDVRAELRRNGVGAELMRRAGIAAAEEGCVATTLHVFVENDAAIEFYERLGFVKITRVEGFYDENKSSRSLDAFLYRKAISPMQDR